MKEQNELIAALIEQLENYKSLNSQLGNIKDLSNTVLDSFKEEMSRIHHSMNTVLESLSDSGREVDTLKNKFTSIQEKVTQYSSQLSTEQSLVVESAKEAILNIDSLFKQLESMQIAYLQNELDEFKSSLDSFTESSRISRSQFFDKLENRLKITEDLNLKNTQRLMQKIESSSQHSMDELRKTFDSKTRPLRMILAVNLILLVLVVFALGGIIVVKFI